MIRTMSHERWEVLAEVSRAVAERAITEREACVELWARTGGDPRAAARAVRAGVRLFEAGARAATFGTRRAARTARS